MTHRAALRLLVLALLTLSLKVSFLRGEEALFALALVPPLVLAELVSACRKGREEQVWLAGLTALVGLAYLTRFHLIALGNGFAMFTVLGVGLALRLIKEGATRRAGLRPLVRPFALAALVMPLVAVGIGVYRHLAVAPVWLGANSLALLLAAGFYFWRGVERRQKPFLILAGLILNVALVLLWRELTWTEPQLFMIPIGVSVLALVQLLRQEIPERFHDPLRYLGALVILVSPTFHIVGGSWIHILALMAASVCIILLAIGLRVRALLYTGTGFLFADLIAMLVRGSIDNPNTLWIAGLLLGAGVLALGAFCERHRETLLARVRLLSDALKAWD